MSTDYGPSITLARLYERVSKSGNHYLVGRIGLAKIAVLKSADVADDGGAIWNVVLQQAPMKSTKPAAEAQEGREPEAGADAKEASQGGPAAPQRPAAANDTNAQRDWQRPSAEDEAIPF